MPKVAFSPLVVHWDVHWLAGLSKSNHGQPVGEPSLVHPSCDPKEAKMVFSLFSNLCNV